MMRKKRMLGLLICLLITLTGCGENQRNPLEQGQAIHMVSREDGSGTRTAFTELFDVVTVDEAGKKQDAVTVEAEITNNTAVMMNAIAGDPAAIGYISMGSKNDTIKALSIDGVEGTPEHVRDGTYAISRPFFLAVREPLTPAADDFKNYILSIEGQKIVQENGYVPLETNSPYVKAGASGKVVVAGSSSVSPVMEKLLETYQEICPEVTVELQTNDSTTGVASVVNGISDLGMVSRSLRKEELEQGILEVEIARDGILVIVNKSNPLESLSKGQVRDIFTGKLMNWQEIVP
ncbi:substrate-binding domain-containing protein [Hominifimenecus sp. rT4P-3]|uniref:substrate-binding domain-containing protein n=1 Tax=Hominifimenecus sp. rT4P-3 TaxID=3242979 RepID=UPI003DA3742A